MNRKLNIFTNGLLRENPLLILNIGLCSSLGITTSIFNGLGMGMGMTFVLVMSELVISIFRKHIPQAIRLPIFIVIIAAFTTIVQMFLRAFMILTEVGRWNVICIVSFFIADDFLLSS